MLYDTYEGIGWETWYPILSIVLPFKYYYRPYTASAESFHVLEMGAGFTQKGDFYHFSLESEL